MTETTDLLMYGIWIPGKGWLRGEQNRALMFTFRHVANETAKRIGEHARIYFIDQSLVDIEGKLLEAEASNYQFFLFDIKRLARFLRR